MLQFPIMTAQEIALDAAFAWLPITVLECCFILFHSRQFRNNQDPGSQLQSTFKAAQPTRQVTNKGTFLSEDTDVFVTSPNRQIFYLK